MPLFAAGSNAHGQLSNGTLDDAHIFTIAKFDGLSEQELEIQYEVVEVCCGANHTLVLLRDQETEQTVLWGCGDGSLGQLGPSETFKHGSSVTEFRRIDISVDKLAGYSVRLISAAWQTTYLVLSCAGKPDVVLSMGSNDFGDLGVQDAQSNGVHVVNFDHLRIGTSHIVVEYIATGQHNVILHLRAISEDQSVSFWIVGWGSARHGQLGPLLLPDRCYPVPQILQSVSSSQEIIQTALGVFHSVFLYSSGKISAYGTNKKGQIGRVADLVDVYSVGCTWNGTYAARRTKCSFIMSLGSNNKGQLGVSHNQDHDNPLPSEVNFPFSSQTHRLQSFACGSEHVLALFTHVDPNSHHDDMKEVWGWGWNEHGNLGIGSTEDHSVPYKIVLPKQPERIWAGPGTSWIYTKTRKQSYEFRYTTP